MEEKKYKSKKYYARFYLVGAIANNGWSHSNTNDTIKGLKDIFHNADHNSRYEIFKIVKTDKFKNYPNPKRLLIYYRYKKIEEVKKGYMTQLYEAKRKGDEKEVSRLHLAHDEEERKKKRKEDNKKHMKIYGIKIEEVEKVGDDYVDTFLEIGKCDKHGKTVMLGVSIDYTGGTCCLECIKELYDKLDIKKIKEAGK